MQNFHDTSASPAPLRGFSSVVGAVGRNSSYQLQPSELQSSLRLPDEYASMLHQNPQTQNQHPSLHTSQAALMQGYEARHRGRGSEEILQGNLKHGSNNANNPYQKETMDYFFLMSSKEGQRRGSHGFGYSTGLGFPSSDGQVPHQYRSNKPTSGTVPGVSQYQMDCSVATGSAGNRSSSTGAFSPSHQYSMAQNPSVTGSCVRRQQAQNYPSPQSIQQEQQHRGYSLPGQRRLPQFSNCPPTNPTTGSARKYNSSPHRYYSGGNGENCKMNNTATSNSNPSSYRNSTNPGTTRSFEGMGQSYPSSDYPYNSNLSHSHCNHQQNVGPSYETSHKMHPTNQGLSQPGLSFPKHPPCSISSSKSSTSSTIPSVHLFSSHEMTKSPMHTQSQQPQFQQNFSPISNPSPAASLVQSPSCSSSPSPLMGISEGLGNSTAPSAHQPSSHSLSNPRNSHSRLSQTMPQLSPTQNSNSSNSSCGSSVHANTTSLNASPGASHSVLTRKGVGHKGSDRCTSSSHYSTSSLEKQVLDPGTSSLNALSSQVANLPNTVQHMLLSDSVLPNNRGKDGGHQPPLQCSPTGQQRNISSSSTPRREGCSRMDSHDINSDEEHMTEQPREAQVEGEEQHLEGEDGKIRQLSETNSVAGLTDGIPTYQNQTNSQTEHDCQGSPSHLNVELSKKKKTWSSQSPPQLQRTDYKTYSSISPSSISSHIPSEGPSTVPPCPSPAPSTSLKSPTPSPTLVSSSQPDFVVPFVIPSDEVGGRKKCSDTTKKEEMCANENEVKQLKTDMCQSGESHIKKIHARRENEGEIHCQVSFKKREDKRGETKETHIEGGVGVIVSTRSGTQSKTLSEQAISASSHGRDQTNILGIPNYCPNREKHSYSSFKDSSSHNGEGDISVPTNAEAHGPKLTGRHSPPPPHHLKPGGQKSPYRFPESVQGSGRSLNTDRVVQSEDGLAPKLNDQACQQPPQHIAGLQKKVKTAEVKGQTRRSMALESGRGHDNTVQQQTFPSLLQEVLQGYHTEKRYRHTENMAPQLQTRTTPQFQNIPYQYPHARHSKSMTESVRNHFLSQSRMSMDCHIPNESSSLGKTYPNQRPEGEINIDQDAGHSWCSGGAGSKEIQWGSLGKVIDSPNHRGNNMPQSSELARPYTKNSSPTVSDYAHPTRKSLSNELNSTSAVQQLLLKAAEPARGNESSVGQVKPHAPSSPLPSLSSLERRSVICDLSPSCLTTHARERSSEGDTVSILPLTGSSVIQQSPSTSVLNQEDSKEEKLHKAMLREEALKTMKEVQNSKKCNYSHSFTKGTTIQLQNRMQQPCGPHQLDTIPGGSVKTAKMPILHTQQAPQQLIPTPNPLSSPSSRFQLYFQGLDESSHHSTGVDGFGLRDSGDGTVKISPRHSYQLSHHNLNASQPKNSQPTNKLQMYPHSHSLQHLHSLNDRLEWGSNTNQPSSQDLMMSPDSSKNQCHAGIRSTPDVLANPQLPPPQGSYYNIGKMWGPSLPGRENKGIMEGDSYRRNEPPVAPSGPMVLPSMPLVVSRHLESNSSRIVTEDVVKSFHQMSTPIKQSDSSSVSGNSGLLGPQGKTKMGGSGDTNPLIMRRRVRSFISPIPAKRQHQDISQQQQQRGVSSMHPSHLSNSDVKPNVDIDPFSPDVPKHKTVSTSDSLDSPPPSLGKMDVLPLRKGRGLKLEAIVQKITPNTKKTNEDSESNTDSTSSLSHTEMTCISDLKDYNSSVGENFSRMETGSVSCLPYLNEGISLEEIISYREVEEIGPLPPTAYQCDPHQDTHILKCDLIEKPTRTTVRDLESALDFGIGVPGAPKSERDTARDGGKDELSPDFTLLGPLPPPPPLPRPVQATSPPSSSALSDIQHFTTTYQQLETRREHSAATLLRQKLEEGEMCLGLDDYSGRDVLGTKSPHHNQNPNHCLLSIPPQNQPHQQHISTGSISSVNGEPQYTQTKPSDSAVPRGYFPSGKKRGRPVGSVNKQKRIQGQSQNASLNASPVTEMPTSVPTATPQTEVQSITSAIPINKTNSDNETSMPLTSVTISLAAKEEIESEEREPEMEANPCRQKGRKEEIGNETDGVVTMPTQRSVVDVFEGEVNSAGIRGNLSSSGVFPTSRKPVFAPYIHVERKLEELGNVCSIVNAEDEKKKAESGEERGGKWTGKEMGGGPVASINPTHTSQSTRNDGERVRSKEKRGAEKENASHIHSSPTGKVLPSSGYVISGSVMTEIDAFGHLLCCLCKKWANYKDLGDLYGPYYPPEYALRFPKNPSVIRQSLGPSSVSTVGALAGAAKIEMKQEITPVALQQCEPATDSSLTGNQTTDPLAATSTDKEASVSALDRHCSSNKGNKDWELTQIPANEVLKQEEQPNEISQLLENEQHVEDIQKRPQHRKLTSHPRFKRRHKSSEDLPKTGPTNSKALLPFQPPPPLPLPNQDSSDPSAPLSLLPQVPLDPDELWVHEGCIIWASGVYLVNGRLYGVQEALDGARETCCSHCKAMGSTLGCYSKGCTLRYHYLCATEAGCALNEDNFSLRCPKHKFPQNNRPVKPVCPAQSEIG